MPKGSDHYNLCTPVSILGFCGRGLGAEVKPSTKVYELRPGARLRVPKPSKPCLVFDRPGREGLMQVQPAGCGQLTSQVRPSRDTKQATNPLRIV